MSDYTRLYMLPWLRRGLARSITAKAVDGLPTQSVGSVEVSVSVGGEKVPQSMRLRGPGEVIGIASGQVVREEPKDGTRDFEPNYFATLDLATPDLPWMFTPAAADDDDRLPPWMVLVTVENRAGVSIDNRVGAPRPVLSIDDAGGELPNLDEAWAWAHVQTTADLSDGVGAALDRAPEEFIARLVSPRRLRPNTSYISCLVPAFEAGRRAGLGLPVTAEDESVSHAWTPQTIEIELPVYHRWSFKTGSEGDFESLAKRLKPRELGPESGVHAFEIGTAGGGLPEAPDTIVDFQGALVSPQADPARWTDPFKSEFSSAIRDLINEVVEATVKPAGYDALQHDPIVKPPLYGGLPAEIDAVPERGGSPTWLVQGNVNPVHRAGAGLGAEAIRRNQERLMATAWDQARELPQINYELRRTRLAAEVGVKLKARLDQLSDGVLLQVTKSAHSRLKTSSASVTLYGRIEASVLPTGLVTAAFRRATRRGGTAARALGPESGVELTGSATARFVDEPDLMLSYADLLRPVGTQLDDASLVPNLTGVLSTGTVMTASPTGSVVGRVTRAESQASEAPTVRRTMRSAADLSAGLSQAQLDLANAAAATSFGRHLGARAGAGPTTGGAFAIAKDVKPVTALYQDLDLDDLLVSPTPVLTDAARLDMEGTADLLRAELQPWATLAARLSMRIQAPSAAWGGQELPETMYVVPEFPDPAYEMLTAIDSEYMLPGVGMIEENTIGLLSINADFVEAFLLGANHELSREFIWREYPADPSGTWIRRFWDATEEASESGEPLFDIEPVSAWSDKGLGKHQERFTEGDSIVLLIKGELLRRYPDTIIYATAAKWDGGDRIEDTGAESKEPLFFGQLGRDTVFLGFDLSEDVARGSTEAGGPNPGWFFVFEEHPSEPRFGLDVERKRHVGDVPRYWKNVSWGHQVDEVAALDTTTHAEALGRLHGTVLQYDDATSSENDFEAEWGGNSRAMAMITLQRPVRILTHADSMLPEAGS